MKSYRARARIIGPRRICGALMLLLITPLPQLAQQRVFSAPQASPPLLCHVLTTSGVEHRRDQLFKASNLKRIQLMVTLSNLQFPLEDSTVVGSVDDQMNTGKPVVEIIVNRIENGTKQRVGAKLFLTGKGINAKRQYLHLFLELPIDGARRDENIKAFLKRAQSDPKATDRARKQLAYQMEHDQVGLMKALQAIYSENQIGKYELSCNYSWRRPDNKPIEFVAPPINIEVVFEGKFFDQPQFR
jgi:hypothetical protein